MKSTLVYENSVGNYKFKIVDNRYFIPKWNPEKQKTEIIPMNRRLLIMKHIASNEEFFFFGLTRNGQKVFSDSRSRKITEMVDFWGRKTYRRITGAKELYRSLTLREIESELTRLFGNSRVAKTVLGVL